MRIQTDRYSLKFLCLLLALALSAPSLLISAQTARRRQLDAQTLPPARYVPSRNYDTRHIKLELRFDWEREQAYGTATITFAPLAISIRSVEFDAAQMTFSGVRLAGGAELQYQFDETAEKLRITLDRAYQPNEEVTVAITYRTQGGPGRREGVNATGGLTFIKPAGSATAGRQIWSQGETEFSRFWFPCHDHPNDFATSEMVATVEKPFIAISNGRLLERRDNGDGTETFHWKMEQPHASYLTSLIVGEYVTIEATHNGIPVQTNVYPNQTAQGRALNAPAQDMIRFFAERTGVRYPNARYAQTIVRGFNGGMENITSTTLSDQVLRGVRADGTLSAGVEALIAHEVAHSWFGNYVTCRTWADLWLNEGFANYFEGIWVEHRYGRDDFLYASVRSNQAQYLQAWQRGRRRPIATSHYADPEALFDAYSYHRGAAVLHMLRVALGDESFWRAINLYLRRYAHQPVETAQFRAAIEEATGQPMNWFFDQWVYQMGHPIFRVTQVYDPARGRLTLTVKQEQRPDPANPYPQARFFRTPVEISIGTERGVRTERVMIEPREEQTFNFAVDSRPLLVNFDRGGALIKELRFEKTTEELIYQLARDEDIRGRLWALEQLAGRLEGPPQPAQRQRIIAGLAQAVRGDAFWGMRLEAVGALQGIAGEAARAALQAATRDRDPRVRARAITALAEQPAAALRAHPASQASGHNEATMADAFFVPSIAHLFADLDGTQTSRAGRQ